MSRSNFEPLQRLKGCSCLHIIPKLYKRNAWFCFDHTYFFKAWELLEQKLDSQVVCIMWQVLHKQDAVGWGRSLRHNRPGRLVLWSLEEERKGTTAVRDLVFNIWKNKTPKIPEIPSGHPGIPENVTNKILLLTSQKQSLAASSTDVHP